MNNEKTRPVRIPVNLIDQVEETAIYAVTVREAWFTKADILNEALERGLKLLNEELKAQRFQQLGKIDTDDIED
jgi:hypothetical protein